MCILSSDSVTISISLCMKNAIVLSFIVLCGHVSTLTTLTQSGAAVALLLLIPLLDIYSSLTPPFVLPLTWVFEVAWLKIVIFCWICTAVLAQGK